MRHLQKIESLEARRLLTHITHFYDPSMGMSDSETPTAAYRAEMVEVPQVSSNGTITVKGTADNDVITVERVTSPLADKNDGEYDFAKYTGVDGSPVWSAGEIDQFVSTEWLAEERAEMAYSTNQRDALLAAGAPVPEYLTKEIERFEKRIAHGEAFLHKLETGKFIRITMEGVYDYFLELTDEQAANSRIVINGGAGQDEISISTAVPLKGTINGESGSDTLTSGKKLSRLSGGNGNDRLISRSVKGGNMVGGKGADRYYNRTGSDIEVLAKADGDKIATTAGLVAVKTAGVFGTQAITSATARTSYKVEDRDGLRDILV